MGPRKDTTTRGGANSKRGKGRSTIPTTQQVGILVQDLLHAEDYDRYIEKFQSIKDVSPQFYCSLWDIECTGFDFHELLRFQNLGTFVELKKGYDESQIKPLYCNVERQDSVSFECAFKIVRVSLNLEKWNTLVQLDCSGVDIEVKDTFTNYNKIDFVKSVSKTGFGELSFSNFSPLQLKYVDRLLHWVVVKIIMCKQHNYGRIDDYDLSIIWLLKNKIKVNWPLFFSNRMISYKNDSKRNLPYPSFISRLLKVDRVTSVNTLLTKPSEVSGLDAKVVQKMHYVKESKGNWYYDDNGVWYNDFIVVAEGTDPESVI